MIQPSWPSQVSHRLSDGPPTLDLSELQPHKAGGSVGSGPKGQGASALAPSTIHT